MSPRVIDEHIIQLEVEQVAIILVSIITSLIGNAMWYFLLNYKVSLKIKKRK